MSTSNRPWTESYFSKWANVPGSDRSLIAKNSIDSSCTAARNASSPMRPHPLIATLIDIIELASLTLVYNLYIIQSRTMELLRKSSALCARRRMRWLTADLDNGGDNCLPRSDKLKSG